MTMATQLHRALDRLETQILAREEIVQYAIQCTFGSDRDVDRDENPDDVMKIKEG